MYTKWIESGDMGLLYPMSRVDVWAGHLKYVLGEQETVREINCGVGRTTAALAKTYKVHVTEPCAAARQVTQELVPSAIFDSTNAFEQHPQTSACVTLDCFLNTCLPEQRDKFFESVNVPANGMLGVAWTEGMYWSATMRLADSSIYSCLREQGQATYTYVRGETATQYVVPWYPITWEEIKALLIRHNFAAFQTYVHGVFPKNIVTARKCY